MLVEGEEPVFEIIDDLTFKYSWSKPNKSFLQALAAPSPVWIYLPAHYVKQFHAKYADPEKPGRDGEGSECRQLGGFAHA